jgi:HEAT repeat protein
MRAKMLGGMLLLLAVVGMTGWAARTQILAWHYVTQLIRASEADRPLWAKRVASLGDPALPRLLSCLNLADQPSCMAAGVALKHLIASWPSDDPHRSDLAEQMTAQFATLSSSGQRVALIVSADLPTSAVAAMAEARLLLAAQSASDSDVRSAALTMADQLLTSAGTPPLAEIVREQVRLGLHDDQVDTRCRAIRLAQRPEIGQLDAVVPLLNDASADVRRSALLAVGPVPEALATDDLLHWLHDPDADIRRLCEQALRGRGINDRQMRLGRIMTDPRPQVRLQILGYLHQDSELDPSIWLRRLSHDPSAAVRAAAARAAGERPLDSLRDRLEQMSQNDPSATVKQLALFYLRQDRSHPNFTNR